MISAIEAKKLMGKYEKTEALDKYLQKIEHDIIQRAKKQYSFAVIYRYEEIPYEVFNILKDKGYTLEFCGQNTIVWWANWHTTKK